MALITSCQATFQNFSGYDDDIASLEENIRECYSEITKTSEQINLSVREEFVSRTELETIQKDFETAQKSAWILRPLRMKLRRMFPPISCCWRNISDLKGRSSNWGRLETPLQQNSLMRSWHSKRMGRRLLISQTRSLL